MSNCYYDVEISDNGKDGWQEYGYTDATSSSIKSLVAGKTYYVRVFAFTVNGDGTFSMVLIQMYLQ